MLYLNQLTDAPTRIIDSCTSAIYRIFVSDTEIFSKSDTILFCLSADQVISCTRKSKIHSLAVTERWKSDLWKLTI